MRGLVAGRSKRPDETGRGTHKCARHAASGDFQSLPILPAFEPVSRLETLHSGIHRFVFLNRAVGEVYMPISNGQEGYKSQTPPPVADATFNAYCNESLAGINQLL